MDELEYNRVLTRLQRRAPSPLPLNQITQNQQKQQQQQRFFSSSSSTPDSASVSPQSCPARFGSGTGKDPIPLLTPLVSPTAGFQHLQQQQGICFGIVRRGD
ncbi:unnamed protein product [Linum trigynum]|uniref:Uncharacterized protein n=1 Tax=Linum trigynum TaxID=586398 RepID=A0AAV2CUJ2_9ROSI